MIRSEQDEVLDSLAAAGQTVAVWRPSDLDGEVLRVLQGRDCGRRGE